MEKKIEEKLAASLTAETTELIPFLPYLLQDFWELGSDPSVMAGMIKKHAGLQTGAKILDLACGKGAVSVKIAKALDVKVKGIDIIPEFIEYATQKAKEFNVNDLCEFIVGDINEAVKNEKDYDCVVFGAINDALGSPGETLSKLKATIKTGGYIIMDVCYLPEDGEAEKVRYSAGQYISRKQWNGLFQESGLRLIEIDFEGSGENPDSAAGMKNITNRANELIKKYPEKKEMFEGYIKSQQNEYDDIDSSLIAAAWILKKC